MLLESFSGVYICYFLYLLPVLHCGQRCSPAPRSPPLPVLEEDTRNNKLLYFSSLVTAYASPPVSCHPWTWLFLLALTPQPALWTLLISRVEGRFGAGAHERCWPCPSESQPRQGHAIGGLLESVTQPCLLQLLGSTGHQWASPPLPMQGPEPEWGAGRAGPQLCPAPCPSCQLPGAFD